MKYTEDQKMNDMAIEVRDLCKSFGDFKLSDVSFSLEKGAVMGLVGQNGAGKTTIIKLMLNALDRDSGSIKLMGLDNIRDEIEIKTQLGYVADDDYLLVTSNLKKYAKMFALMYPTWDQKLFEQYATRWELPPTKKFGEFSKGMKMKAMFALTLAHKPKLLLLDEPTSGLDPVARIEVLDFLREIVSDGETSVLFSTHITGDLDKIADYITVVIDGKVTESLSVDAVEDKYAVVQGSITALNTDNEKLAVGIRRGHSSFEALVERHYVPSFGDVSVHTPNVENLLTFSIWGNRADIVEIEDKTEGEKDV